MEERTVDCNICGSNNYEVLYEEGKAQTHRIVKCRECGLMYSNPQKDNVGNVEKNYLKHENEDSDNFTHLSEFNPETHQYLKKQFLQLRDYSRIIDFVDKGDKGTLLEIGSFAGILLNEAKKRGWDVIGIEPLEIPALYAEKVFGIKVIRKYFEQSGLQDNTLDVIISCHVIEHVPDPYSFLKKAYELLKPGGKLILETPTYDSQMFKLLKHRERSIRCDGHLYFFTMKTLSSFVEKCGFTVLKHEKVGRTLTIDRLFYNLGKISGKEKYFSWLSGKLKLDRFVIKINMRDMQRIYCQK